MLYSSCEATTEAEVSELLKPRAVTPEACVLWSPCSTMRGATAVRRLHTAATESLQARKTPCSQKERKKVLEFNMLRITLEIIAL